MLRDLIGEHIDQVLARVDASPLFGKDILVVGGTGLIGQTLSAVLRHSVDTGLGSVTCPRNLVGVKPRSYDFIIHAGGYAQPARFTAEPMETIAINTTGLMRLVEALRPGGRLLYLSSSELYSGNPKGLYSETDIGTTTPAATRACYIESKRCGEAICHAARTSGRNTVIARVNSVYGPGVKLGDKRVISELIDGALRNGKVTLSDGGQAIRIFCYVSDTVEMLMNVLLYGVGDVYNVGHYATYQRRIGGSGNILGETTIASIARKIGEILKVPVHSYKSKALRDQSVVGAPSHVALDISRYTREFGEKSFVELEDGLRRTIEWHRQLMGVRAMDAKVEAVLA